MNKSMDESRSELHFKVHSHSHNTSLRWKFTSLLRNCTLKKNANFGNLCTPVLSQKEQTKCWVILTQLGWVKCLTQHDGLFYIA